MKKHFFYLLLAFFCLVFAGQAQAKEVEVSLINNTGKTMNYLYITVSGSKSWEDDLLGPKILGIRTLESGRSCDFLIDDSVIWDLRADFKDGSNQEYYDFNFAQYKKITLNKSDANME